MAAQKIEREPVKKQDRRPLTYRDAGVDIAAGEALVDAIKPAAASTRRAGADAALGGFGALFDLRAAGFRDPILIASTDGVGTKIKLAIETGRHRGIGIDLVAMCANDIVVQGAEPLFFLDYFATGRLRPDVAREVIEGVAAGCREAGCALIGGETAEMPGMYAAGDYDLAGFVVGAAERGSLLDGRTIAPGDRLLGLPSAGLHANGFSLVRRLLADVAVDLEAPAPFDPDRTLAQALLVPTRIYARACLALHRRGLVKGFAHITGGGLTENVPRMLPRGLVARMEADRWRLPPVFSWLREAGAIEGPELVRTFNCGIGMVAALAPEDVEEARALLRDEHGLEAVMIGEIAAAGDGGERGAAEVLAAPGTWGYREGFRALSGDFG